MTSSQHGSYTQGYTHPTMAKTTSSKPATASKSLKFSLSSDRGLQFDPVKSELLVIADQQVAVNTFSPLVHTAYSILINAIHNARGSINS
jgi:hypothetical protein